MPTAAELRRVARSLLHATGVLELMRRLRPWGVRILVYHRFPPRARDATERQWAHLRRRYRPTTLTALAAMLADGAEPPPHTVVVTVDDGYRDFYENAYPLLRQYGIPATLFVPTGFVDGHCWLWGDRARYCLRRTRRRRIEVPLADGRVLQLSGGTGSEGSARLLNSELKRCTPSARDAVLAGLEQATGVKTPERPPPEFAPCSWDEIREVARAGIDIGAHSVTHPILSRLEDAAALRCEILEPQRRLEEQLQRPVRHFAYPNGRWEDIGPEALRLVRGAFAAAVSMSPGWNDARTDLHLLHRTAVTPLDPLDVFSARLVAARASLGTGHRASPAYR